MDLAILLSLNIALLSLGLTLFLWLNGRKSSSQSRMQASWALYNLVLLIYLALDYLIILMVRIGSLAPIKGDRANSLISHWGFFWIMLVFIRLYHRHLVRSGSKLISLDRTSV